MHRLLWNGQTTLWLCACSAVSLKKNSQQAILMPIRGYSPDFKYQLFSTFGPIPGSFWVQISVLFWQTPIQWRLGLIPGLVQQLSAYWKIKSKQQWTYSLKLVPKSTQKYETRGGFKWSESGLSPLGRWKPANLHRISVMSCDYWEHFDVWHSWVLVNQNWMYSGRARL